MEQYLCRPSAHAFLQASEYTCVILPLEIRPRAASCADYLCFSFEQLLWYSASRNLRRLTKFLWTLCAFLSSQYNMRVKDIVQVISNWRSLVGGGKDQGIVNADGSPNIVPADGAAHALHPHWGIWCLVSLWRKPNFAYQFVKLLRKVSLLQTFSAIPDWHYIVRLQYYFNGSIAEWQYRKFDQIFCYDWYILIWVSQDSKTDLGFNFGWMQPTLWPLLAHLRKCWLSRQGRQGRIFPHTMYLLVVGRMINGDIKWLWQCEIYSAIHLTMNTYSYP